MPAAAPRPESQEDILDAALAALTEADVPPDDETWGVPDPDCGRPAELADLIPGELDQLAGLEGEDRAANTAATTVTPARPAVTPAGPAATGPTGTASSGFDPPGRGLRDRAGGGAGFAGFAQDGVLDLLAPGVPLAGFADAAHARLTALTGNELVGVLAAWRRQTSWAQARELAAVAELARRRPADRTPPAAAVGEFPAQLSEFIAAEIAMALTLTRHGGEVLLELALD
ncbi:MAG: hypothetical protein ACRDND_33970, partial [Streptosporangiaceae bacterium]